ncbi:MAG: serine/threonine protein kinase, partial [Deltaproteobacteria bacterium]|nr:serine/threonine protein kinase [Deltaproteobacteria bacterium]MBW2533893.1 serine/threonine protein kinase [Deltaproteobacteria bacterium]
MEYRIVPGAEQPEAGPQRMVGRCEMFDEIACGGMATIHLGRMLGAGGFTRTVAIKRLHPQYAKDPHFVDMFLDEARIVARIRHPNVVPTLDLVEEEGDLYIIMEYIEGVNFGELMKEGRKRKERVPLGAALRIAVGMLHGLHAAHEATNEKGEPMRLVHRDMSPDNALVGVDGFPRVLDFGVARARGRATSTRDGQVKGKLSYMAPEQVLGEQVDGRTDVFACSAVLWQALTGKRLFKAKQLVELTHKILNMEVPRPSDIVSSVPKKLDSIVLKGLARSPDDRWSSALAMAEAIEAVGHLASHREVGLWVRKLGATRLRQLATKVSALERKPVKRRGAKSRRVEQRSRLMIDEAERQAVLDEIAAERAAKQAGGKPAPPRPGSPPRLPQGRGGPKPPARKPIAPQGLAEEGDADTSGEFAALMSGEIPLSSDLLEGQVGQGSHFDSGTMPALPKMDPDEAPPAEPVAAPPPTPPEAEQAAASAAA